MAAKHGKFVTLVVLLILGHYNLFSQAGVNIEIMPGFSGSFNAGYWIPITLIIDSELPPFEAVLEASLPLGGIHRADRGSYSIIRRFSLEPGSSRRVLLTVPVMRNEELSVRLSRDGEQLTDRRFSLNPYGYSGQTVLLLSRRPDIGIPGGSGRLTLAAHPEALPVSPAGYSSIAAVILHDAPLNEISPLQTDALIGWVRGGGLLVVTGGITRPELLPGKLTDIFPYIYHGRAGLDSPPELSGSDSRPLPSALSYPLRLAELKDDALSPAAGGENGGGLFPFEAVRTEGRGRVAACLIDPAEGPYNQWTGLSDYWELLLSSASGPGTEYPVSDPLPDLHSRLIGKMPSSSPPFYLMAGIFLSPLAVLLIPTLLKRRLRCWLILSIGLPFAAALSMLLLLPAERPVYREISLIRGNFSQNSGDLWLKGGITSRAGGDFPLELDGGDYFALPNSDESLTISGSPRLIHLERERWDSREVFLGTSTYLPVDSEVSRKGLEVSGFISWKPGSGYRDAILIGGNLAAERVFLLPEKSGLSFRTLLSRQSAALDEESGYIKDALGNFTPASSAYLNYLILQGMLPREEGADFYILLFEQNSPTILTPEETEKIGLQAVLLEFSLEDIDYED